MANVVRNELTIVGNKPRHVLDDIGFESVIQPENTQVLFDFDRVVPRPQEQPAEGWDEWFSENWGTSPYDGALPGDIIELTDKKASFNFYTRWTPAFRAVQKVAERFPAFKFLLRTLDETNSLAGEAAWQNGRLTLYLRPFALKLTDEDLPANDPVTPEIKVTAARLVQAAIDAYEGQPPQKENAENVVAETIAESGRAVKVEFRQNDDGSACLCVEVESQV